jgi:hypothetical protein
MLAIKDVPAGFEEGSSRLASPPPNATDVDVVAPLSSWGEEDATPSPAPSPMRLMEHTPHAAAQPSFSAPEELPETWEDIAVFERITHQAVNIEPEVQEVSLNPVADLFVRPAVPLLPCPTPASPHPSLEKRQPTSEARRSARFVNKPKMHAMDKAIQVLNSKMGVAREGVPLLQARKEYLEKYKTQLPNATVDALAKLFKLNIRSITEADEALIAMGGPGGSEAAAQDLTA